jgi:hypothetical protein
MVRILRSVLALSGLLSAVTPSNAAPITLVPNTLNMFRDTRGVNDVGIGSGDLFQYGASIQGGSAGSTLGAVYPPTGFTDPQANCAPLTVNPEFCANATGFSASRIAQPWTFQFRNGTDALDVSGPSLTANSSAILNQVPFPVSVTITQGTTATTPTISWVVPNNFPADAFRINIFDRSAPPLPNGQRDVIHSAAIDPRATNYTIPATLSAGGSLVVGQNYSINFQIIETRNHVSFTSNNNALILRRSNSFFAFSPSDTTGPPNVNLPQVIPDTNPNDNFGPVYVFTITSVGPNTVTFIDPVVAVGYDYAIGQGDPNFASVLLPEVGDDSFELIFGGVHNTILAGQQFFFPQGGVSAFSVRGIETSAGLDPNNVNAFLTGLTFVSEGSFTGTMTPIIEFVPETTVPAPGALALLVGGLAVLTLKRRTS